MTDGAVVVTQSDGVAQCGAGQVPRHAWTDRVADDATREGVFDRGHIELAIARRGVFGDVGEPELVHARRAEITLHQVVVDGRTGFLA